ncbi:MAG: indolepyruvate ferredoxin oxidoreductase family protein, partial [Microvirga sp.]
FQSWHAPIVAPANVAEYLEFGLYGWALSRFSGNWVGFTALSEVVESGATVDLDLVNARVATWQDADTVRQLTGYTPPPGGLHYRWPDLPSLVIEQRLHAKLDAVRAYASINSIDRHVVQTERATVGIVTAGKAHYDLMEVLRRLDIPLATLAAHGVRIYKLGLTYPIEPTRMREFTRGLKEVLVIEEKGPVVEEQLRSLFYNERERPVIVGKQDAQGRPLVSAVGELRPSRLIEIVARWLVGHFPDLDRRHLVRDFTLPELLSNDSDTVRRLPYFCAGCPHNTSTRVPEGSHAQAGIGCHFMASWMDRKTDGYTQMGGEGANWIGESNFSTRKHVFQNLGDGTYNHSGSLALRWAIHTKTTVTYKILFNDAVAMTGGQQHEGGLTVDMIARQVRAEGAERIALVTDEPDKYPSSIQWPSGMTIDHRDDLERVQRELAEVPGVSVLIYDQTCAAEKRRRRKRGSFPDPDKRVIINDLVCEACGDCSVQSNCVAVQPVETEFGRKRQIDQSNCNKDFSCVKGFCPSFVTVHGATPRKAVPATVRTEGMTFAALPEPAIPAIEKTFNIVVTGVGGTGVVTIGAILGMAAHLEGKGCGMIDMAGLAQKGGAVYSHVRLANDQDDIHAIRVTAGAADLVLGCDLVVTGTKKVLASVAPGRTGLVVNTAEIMPGDFTRNADFSLPAARIKRAITAAAGGERVDFVDATAIATGILGNAIAANMFMLGFAYQLGRVPLSGAAIRHAIELNGEAVKMNLDAFDWGRRAAAEPKVVGGLMGELTETTESRHLSQSLDEIIARRVAYLTDYQNAAYAERYRLAIERVREAEARTVANSTALTEAAARSLFALMAYKDEYEVGRLYTNGHFEKQVAAAFEGKNLRYEFHMAPPLLARRDKTTGLPRKMSFGPWMLKAFAVLAKLKGLRGTPFDVFGYTHERKVERRLIGDYEALLSEIVATLAPQNHAIAVGLANLPKKIRGFGHIKARNLEAAKREEAELLARFRAPSPALPIAAE